MPLTGLPTSLVQIPIAAGLNQRMDARAKMPPSLDICRDGQFDELGGIQTRLPYEVLGTLAIESGGTIAVADVRRLTTNGDELLLWTKTNLYSWSQLTSKWQDRGEHAAIALDEEIVFASNGDQMAGDRAECQGVQYYAWIEGTNVYVAARDSATKASFVSAQKLTGETMPRLIKLVDYVMLFTIVGTTLKVRILKPLSILASLAAASFTVIASGMGANYDVALNAGVDTGVVGVARLASGTSYIAFTTDTYGTTVTSTKARACDGPIACAVTVAGTQLQIARSSGLNVVGDLLTISTLADVRSGDAIGSTADTPTQVVCVYPAVAAASERCDVYYNGTIGVSRKNTITTAGTLGTDALFQPWLFLASHAFARPLDAHTYIWGFTDNGDSVFGNLQSQYILYRDDGRIMARSRIGNAQSPQLTLSLIGYLPSVQPTANADEYAFLGVYKRLLTSVGALQHPSFTARAPRDVVVTFDSNAARRTAKFGKTLYVAGGLVLQYDGVQLTELNFCVGPTAPAMADLGVVVAQGLDAGTYNYESTLRSINAVGEVDRSSSYGIRTIPVLQDHQTGDGTNGHSQLWYTRKVGVAVETWRSAKNLGPPYYLVSSNDPTAVNPNGYISIDKTSINLATFIDTFRDAAITSNESHPEAGTGQLPALPPPPATIIRATNQRLFLTGIAGLPNTIYYSKYRADNKAAAFNDQLLIDVPPVGGKITAIAFIDYTIILFRETAIYAFAGQGIDDTGGGTNFELVRTCTTDVGAINYESLVTTDSGIVFKSSKGWHLLDRSLSVQFIGAGISSFDSEIIQAAHLVPGQHQLRVITSNRVLMFDNVANQWCEWTITNAVGATIWQGQHVYLSNTAGVLRQRTDFANGVTYGLDVETAWFKLADIQGFARVQKYQLLGEYKSDHHLRFRFAYNYKYDGAGNPLYVDDVYWTPYPITVGSALQVQVSPSLQQIESVKVRITASNPAENGTAPTAGASIKLTGISMEVGIKKGLYKLLSSAQRR